MPGKRRGYRLSPLAEHDLEDIWLYTCKTWSRGQADRCHGLIVATIDGIASGDKIGRDAGDIRQAYKRCSAGRHVIFYREESDAVVVIRILHQRMDLPSDLGAGEA